MFYRCSAWLHCGGKSGQQRVPYFLTGRGSITNYTITESATENYTVLLRQDKGENAR